MMKYCRENFSTLLDKNSLLFKLFDDHFDRSHMLINNMFGVETDFKNYIYSLVDVKKEQEVSDELNDFIDKY